ncbi:GNAT family N-acetyltransferase [Cellulomonas cellasea]|uniref:N-acetyltransferase domain-containing protein n=1 Tax=Cellulomonas cellasea DSM 20118 TaxID=1408250 RepID=A0A0A0B7A0_9CELL|nr:GNAT family N-acetyltransferase [Cellulomonas cellasea]KGM01679.1 hypothetical protein Q760_18045 [Cellulomonas cellasea DSM 20118]
MHGPTEVTTDRLRLTATTTSELAELHALHADPAVWTHFPSGRYVELATTEALVHRIASAWQEHGLDYWTARRRDDAAAGIVGIGGCSLRAGLAWNLYYRLAPTAWGRGYARELVGAALEAAEHVRPELPVVAYLLEHNEASRRTAERAGLTLAWRGPDAGNPDPAAVRLVYADRPLSREALRAFVDA